jgi:hypothetical protein
MPTVAVDLWCNFHWHPKIVAIFTCVTELRWIELSVSTLGTVRPGDTPLKGARSEV